MDRGICLKKYEVEALLKSFFLFFSLQMVLLLIIFMQSYKEGSQSIDEHIYNRMKICSYDLKCKGFELDFISKTTSQKVQKLYKKDAIYTLFDVPTAEEYLLKVILPTSEYSKLDKALKNELIQRFILYALLIALLSFLFSFYSLRPLKHALRLNKEFVQDILHDINTPLSALVINFKLFTKEIGENRKIERMHASVSSILSLQNNLRAFLDNSPLEKEQFALEKLLQERIAHFQVLYPKITFLVEIKNPTLHSNKDAFVRILDNLLSNACKYNRQNGTVKISYENNTLSIEDNGKGIEDVKKVFQRYYKENERGVGIGMHIVKNFCDTLNIGIEVESEVDKGTRVLLDLREVILK